MWTWCKILLNGNPNEMELEDQNRNMTNLDSIFKSGDITLPTKVCLAKAMVFPVVMYGCESWTVKKAERQIIDAFELWCWRRLLRVPWTARRSNQSILISLEGMMRKLKLQYFGHLVRRVDSLEKTLMLGEIGGRRRRGWPRMRWLDGITDSVDMSLSEHREMVVNREAWHAAIHGVAKSRTQLSDWTELKEMIFICKNLNITLRNYGGLRTWQCNIKLRLPRIKEMLESQLVRKKERERERKEGWKEGKKGRERKEGRQPASIPDFSWELMS